MSERRLAGIHDTSFSDPPQGDLSPLSEYSERAVTLTRLQWAFQEAALPAALVASMRFEQYQDELLGHLVYRVKGELLADKLPPVRVTEHKIVTFDRPATWWQAWKHEHRETWYGGWLARWREPKMVREYRNLALTVDLERYRTYPEQGYVLPPDRWGKPVLAHALHTNVLDELTEVSPL